MAFFYFMITKARGVGYSYSKRFKFISEDLKTRIAAAMLTFYTHGCCWCYQGHRQL